VVQLVEDPTKGRHVIRHNDTPQNNIQHNNKWNATLSKNNTQRKRHSA